MESREESIKKAIFDGAVEKGAKESAATHHANAGLSDYKQNNFTKVYNLVDQRIKMAVQETKKAKKR